MQPIVCIFCQASIPYLGHSRKYCDHLEDWHNITVTKEVHRAVEESLARREKTGKEEQMTKAQEPTVVHRLGLSGSTASSGCDVSTVAEARYSLENICTAAGGKDSLKKVPKSSSLFEFDGRKQESPKKVSVCVAPEEHSNKSTSITGGSIACEESLDPTINVREQIQNKRKVKRKSLLSSDSKEVLKMRKLNNDIANQHKKVDVNKKLKSGRNLSKIIKRLNSQDEDSLFEDNGIKKSTSNLEKVIPPFENINKVTAVSGEELEVSFFEETPEKPEVSTCSLPRKVKSKPIKQEVFPPMDWYNGAPVECGVCGQQVPRSQFHSRHIRIHGLKTKDEYESRYGPVPQVSIVQGKEVCCRACVFFAS